MDPKDLNRRDFHKLSMAALGGVIGGVVFSNCGPAEKPAEEAPSERGTSSRKATRGNC